MASVPVYTSECRHTVSSNAKSDANATMPSSPQDGGAVDTELPVAVDRFLPYLPSSLFETLSLYFTHKNSAVGITINKCVKLTSVACVRELVSYWQMSRSRIQTANV